MTSNESSWQRFNQNTRHTCTRSPHRLHLSAAQVDILDLWPRKNPKTGKTYGMWC